jgi:hypothetical protein
MFAAVLLSLVAISFWIMWGPIAWRGLRTGRLLARGVIYDRESNPRMFWGGLVALGSLGLLFSGLALWAVARL